MRASRGHGLLETRRFGRVTRPRPKRVATIFGLASLGLLAVTSANAATRPGLPLPACKITGSKYYTASGRLVGKGACAYMLRQNGKLRKVVPYGQKWSYTAFKVYDFTGSSCVVKKPAGVGNSVLVQPTGTYTAATTYRLWLPKNRYHRAGRAVTKTVSVVLGGKVVCGTPAVVAPEGPNNPTGSGNGGDSHGFYFSFAGEVIVDSSGVHLPAIDTSGNGQCQWRPDGDTYDQYGYTFYPGTIHCANGEVGIPGIYLDVTRPDGSQCRVAVGGVQTFPLKPGWGGSFSGEVKIGDVASKSIPLQKGTANGPPLC